MDPEDLDTQTLALLLAARLRERICKSPVSTLAGAAAVGYVLGWSMPSALYRTLVSVGLRAVAMQVVTRVLGPNEDDDEHDAGLDLDAAGGGMTGNPRQPDVPPYVA